MFYPIQYKEQALPKANQKFNKIWVTEHSNLKRFSITILWGLSHQYTLTNNITKKKYTSKVTKLITVNCLKLWGRSKLCTLLRWMCFNTYGSQSQLAEQMTRCIGRSFCNNHTWFQITWKTLFLKMWKDTKQCGEMLFLNETIYQ